MTNYLTSLSGASVDSPIGTVYLTADKFALYSCSFIEPLDYHAEQGNPLLLEASRQLNTYFEGKRKAFNIPLHLAGSTFYMKIWSVLQEIEYGRTTSYKQIAELLKVENGARAVGRAVGTNPLLIFIPCHRVIGDKGSLTGYKGGKERKRFLLQMELSNPTNPNRNLLF
jgi:O-6-methylguanine DNA methyltransferase